MLGSFINQAPVFLYTMMTFIIVLSIIVFIHEMGHFLVGRWCGARVDAFSIGFGREVFGWNDRYGTRWKLSWLPLGGYVKFSGDANAASMGTPDALKDPTTFHGRPLWQRALIVAAGPMANFLLAIVLFAGLYVFVGKPYISPVIVEVIPQSAAAQAGLKAGDRITRIDDRKVTSFTDITRYVSAMHGVEITVHVKRNDNALVFKATPRPTVREDGMGGKIKIGLLGIKAKRSKDFLVKKGPLEALVLGTEQTWSIITRSLSHIKAMVQQRVSADQLAGPIGIAKMTGKVAQIGISPLIQLAAILSVSIGLINLFPVPMLDGGHLMYYAIEAIRGKALSQKAQEVGFMVGFALVISLMLFATKNDIMLRTGWFAN